MTNKDILTEVQRARERVERLKNGEGGDPSLPKVVALIAEHGLIKCWTS